ncbi:MAG: GNAT family N-acetyltransferase [Simkaniaceae bacterium]
MNVQIRIANREDLDWINSKYYELQFSPSVYENEFIAIAEWENETIGVGRLICLGNNSFELGGIYVADQFREQGVAKKIAFFLLQRVKEFHTVYCLPFSHLMDFYQKLGFELCREDEEVPEEIRIRHKSCQDTYQHRVLLMKLVPNPAEIQKKELSILI